MKSGHEEVQREPADMSAVAEFGEQRESAPEQPFERLVGLAVELLHAPAAAITLRDAEGTLVDGSVGLITSPEASEPVVRPFCGEVIETEQPVIVGDATRISRFADDPGIQALGVQAYLGIPLRLGDGQVCGSFCVLDFEPRRWTAQDVGVLEALTAAVASEMGLHLAARNAERGQREAESARAEAEQAHRRLEFLAEATLLLADSLDYEKTLDTVTRLALPLLADWCAVHLRQDDGRVSRLTNAAADSGDQRDRLPLLDDYETFPSDTPVGPARVVRTGKTELVAEITDGYLRALAVDDGHFKALCATGWRSMVIAPLTLRGRTFGSLACATTDPARRYSRADVRLIEELAGRAATALENARLYRERDIVAQTLQRSLLPPTLPDVPGLTLAAHYRPAHASRVVGGDFYDLFQTSPGEWVAAIGDVCGKGIHAASLTGLVRHVIRTAAMQSKQPSQVFAVLNDALPQDGAAPQDTRFCTALCLRLRPVDEGVEVVLACGGHPRPLILRADGTVEHVVCEGMLLGVFADAVYEDSVEYLAPGDTMLLFTDGLTEARHTGELFGTQYLKKVLTACRGLPADALTTQVAEAVAQWEDGDVRDDLAILTLQATRN